VIDFAAVFRLLAGSGVEFKDLEAIAELEALREERARGGG
jgi:hypothetical protein